MFKFLKDKLRSTISKISKKVKEEGKEEVVRVEPKPEVKKEEIILEEKPKKGEVKVEKVEEKEEKIEEKRPKPKVEKLVEKKGEIKKEIEEEAEEKKGFFGKIKEKVVTKKINEKQFEELFWNLEVALLENNVATEVIGKIKEDLKQELVEKPIRRSKIEKTIEQSLKKSIGDLFEAKPFNLLDKIKQKKPFVVCFVGINGSGKTTTIAKIAKMLLNNNKKVVLAAADTFRAAAIDQLQIHADKLGVKLIKHDYGSDPAAVAFDAIKHAESKNIDVVLIDTAGRMHANSNLMDEMSKIVRVAKPDLKIFVGESITGNDCVEQAKRFDEAVGIDAIILSKADVDEKGGAAVSVSYVTKKPIIYIGVGQEYKDLKEFDSEIVLQNLGLEA
ncbi:signal recognition particle-docking protein FtsY [Candidatus Woesearchaeota archaeon]|nr:signal recognition particle-docking protein FtsY [Candidatus Woesearchaeota archaeon]